ncbi:MAG: AI-2E family transporter [Pseudomonadota bacterium]|nr:AI-2E family transporter [Gammaproteobacteria bacterium]MBU1629204.1 AI-2E family transporter [Gammaproteobacteria bacterium]MBU1926488.1 AI-2E family transporter [Gammaproteobacteria bacterium]MBU2546010.1 AI-2E family transporter [Gammaproteobacteria bacterium]
MTDSQRWFLVFGLLLTAGLIYLLAPVLTPFLIAALLAYLFNPLVDRLTRWHVPRIFSVTVVFVFVLLLVSLLVLLFVPILQYQLNEAIKEIPAINQWLGRVIWPWVNDHFHVQSLDLSHLQNNWMNYFEKSSGIITQIWKTLSASGIAVVAFLVNLILVFVATFYLLCDWKAVTQAMINLLPRARSEQIVSLMKECGDVLSSFFRGQLLVMIGLGLMYGIGLWIIGMDVGILIGVLAGLVSIVPYLGFFIGILLALLISLIQFHTWIHLLGVVIVFCVGQLTETFVLTPYLVGDRVGLHPLLVIFSVLAGGQLFGFVGVLLAVPVSAVIMVFLKRLRTLYQ